MSVRWVGESEGRRPELLATVKELSPTGEVRNRGFGNILDLDCRSLVLEANREFENGTPLIVNVVFPGRTQRENPLSSLHCIVRSSIGDLLHYDLTIVELEGEARVRLDEYLAWLGREGDSRVGRPEAENRESEEGS